MKMTADQKETVRDDIEIELIRNKNSDKEEQRQKLSAAIFLTIIHKLKTLE